MCRRGSMRHGGRDAPPYPRTSALSRPVAAAPRRSRWPDSRSRHLGDPSKTQRAQPSVGGAARSGRLVGWKPTPRSGMRPAAIGEDILAGDGAAGVAGEEKHDIGDVLRLEQVGHALRAPDESLNRWGDELLQLAFGHDPARRDGIHADAARSEFAGERPGEPSTPPLVAT